MTDTGSFPAIRTGGFPKIGNDLSVRSTMAPRREPPKVQKQPITSASISFSSLRQTRKRKQQTLQLILTGVAVFLLLFCFTGVTAYAAVSSALSETDGGTPLPASYELSPISTSIAEPALLQSAAVEFSQEDYEERLLIPTAIVDDQAEPYIPPTPPQDEDGRYILANSDLPETYTVTVETEEGVFTYKTYTKTEEISYKTVYKDTRELAKGKEVVQTEGHSGSTTYTIKETYLDGVLKEKEITDKTVTKTVQNRVILRGIGQAVTGSDGKNYAYKSQLNMKAYCYYAGEDGGSRSATGKKLKSGMIAVDPRVIPLGTRVYIDAPGTKFDGVYVAEDTGGAIKGNIIDIFMESKSQALSFGTQSVKVYILE